MEDIEPIFLQYRDDVYRLALSYTHSPHEAEDVCQSVFLKLMQSTVQCGKERPWLMQVTANECRSLLRSASWRRTAPLDTEIPTHMGEFAYVYQSVMSIPPKYRVVIYLRYYELYSTKEIAALLHISQSAVTTRLSRAREMLKDKLKEEAV